jgi:protein-disulfide isomerase
MFEDNRNLTLNQLKQKASVLKLDMPAFVACVDSGKYAETVAKDIREGTVIGVSPTPSIFINGRFLSGFQPYIVLEKIIVEELKKMPE